MKELEEAGKAINNTVIDAKTNVKLLHESNKTTTSGKSEKVIIVRRESRICTRPGYLTDYI